MAGKALQTVFSEMTVKDAASASMAKMDKAVDKTAKTLKKTEEQAKKTEKETGKLGSSFNKMQKAGEAAKAKAESAGKQASSGIGAFTGAFAGIPIIGGVIAAAMAATAASAGQYTEAISLKKELGELGNNFKAGFKKHGQEIMNKLRAGDYFSEKDVQAAFSGMRDTGIKESTLASGTDQFEQFAKAQGYSSMSEAMAALQSGNIKHGRGVGDMDIKMLQQYATVAKGGGPEADIAMKGMIRILKRSAGAQESFRQATEDATAATNSQANMIERTEQQITLAGEGSGSAAYQKGAATRMNVNESIRTVADIADPLVGLVNAGMEKAGKIAKRLTPSKKKAAGGDAHANEPIVVGEVGREVFTPKTAGKITPHHALASGGISVTIQKLEVNVPFGSMANGIVGEVRKALDTLAKGTMRMNTGLQMAS
jgi:hypothetical protein